MAIASVIIARDRRSPTAVSTLLAVDSKRVVGDRARIGRVVPTETGDHALHVVVVERPRRRRADPDDVERVADRPLHLRLHPRRQQQVERERLVELLVVDERRHQVGSAVHVRLGDHHQVATGVAIHVVVDRGAELAPHVVALGAEHGERVLPRDLEHAGALGYRWCVRQFGVFADRGDRIDAEALDTAVEPEL